MFHHCVLTGKKNLQKSGWPPHCKGCPEWLKKANDSIKDLKLNVSSLSFDRKKNQRKSGCPLLQRVPRNIEKSQWFSSKSWNLEIQWFIIVGFDRKNSAKIWVPPIAKGARKDWKKANDWYQRGRNGKSERKQEKHTGRKNDLVGLEILEKVNIVSIWIRLT